MTYTVDVYVIFCFATKLEQKSNKPLCHWKRTSCLVVRALFVVLKVIEAVFNTFH